MKQKEINDETNQIRRKVKENELRSLLKNSVAGNHRRIAEEAQKRQQLIRKTVIMLDESIRRRTENQEKSKAS